AYLCQWCICSRARGAYERPSVDRVGALRLRVPALGLAAFIHSVAIRLPAFSDLAADRAFAFWDCYPRVAAAALLGWSDTGVSRPLACRYQIAWARCLRCACFRALAPRHSGVSSRADPRALAAEFLARPSRRTRRSPEPTALPPVSATRQAL